jgi:hypothetical protein
VSRADHPRRLRINSRSLARFYIVIGKKCRDDNGAKCSDDSLGAHGFRGSDRKVIRRKTSYCVSTDNTTEIGQENRLIYIAKHLFSNQLQPPLPGGGILPIAGGVLEVVARARIHGYAAVPRQTSKTDKH